MLALLSNPAIVALIAGIPSLIMAVIGYRQAVRVDKRADEVGADSLYLSVMEALREDNQALRQSNAELMEKLARLRERRT